jgi:propanediol dehydratase small subunit
VNIDIDAIVKTISEKLKNEAQAANAAVTGGNGAYPLSQNAAETLKSKSGKSFSEITFDGVIEGGVTHDDFKTDPKTLLMQADIAEKAGKKQFADNLRRAAELTNVPDNEVLAIYDKLRPNRATKEELLQIAGNLRQNYNANITAALIVETANIYEKRHILL